MKSFNIIITVLAIVLCGSFYYIYSLQAQIPTDSTCPDKYPYISSDLNCDADPYTKTLQLKQITESLVETLLTTKRADRISVFYRDLDNRQWFGINENDLFVPGSLLKLPLAIAYYKIAEVDEGTLNLKNKYVPPNAKDAPDLQYKKPEKELEANKVYTVEELIEQMIKYSDNAPVAILKGAINDQFFDKVYADLGISIPSVNGESQDFVSTKTYASILRSLFNASYLNQYYSNKLLGIMSTSTFRSGIVSGVPDGVKVANKFGERIIPDPTTGDISKVELHDCGIVYEDTHPYVLCVMTQGTDYERLINVLTQISKTVYNNR